MRVLTVVDGTVDADGPHTRGVSVTVTVVLLPAVTGRPDVDIAQSVSALIGTRERTMQSFLFSLSAFENRLKI